MGLGARIGAGVSAPIAAAAGAVAPLNDNEPAPIHNTPAIYQEIPEEAGPRSLEDVASQYSGSGFTVNVPEEFRESQPASLQEPVEAQESEPSTSQKLGDIGDCVGDIGSTLAETKMAKDRAEDNEEQNNALNEPVSSQETPPKQDAVSELETGQLGQNTPEMAQNSEPDYYNGYGY